MKWPRCPHPGADISSLGASRQKQRLCSLCHSKVTCGRWTPAPFWQSLPVKYLLCDKIAFHCVDQCRGFSLHLKHCPSTVWNACKRLWEQCQEVCSCGSGGQPCAMLESVLIGPLCIRYVQFFHKESRWTLGLQDLGSQMRLS